MSEQEQIVEEGDVEEFTLDLDLPDEDVTPEGGSGDTTEPVVETTPKETAPAAGPKLTDLEKTAYAQGWRPKEDFIKAGNDPAAWKDAGWWLDRGELLGQQAQLRKELKEIKNAFIRMTEHNRSAYVKGQQDVLNQLKASKREAMKMGDLETVAELDDKIDQQTEIVRTVEQEAAKPVMPKEERSLENSAMYQNWQRDNPWYTTDKVLHTHANAAMAIYVQENPKTTPEAALQYISDYIRSEFPHKFTRERKIASPSVGGRGNQTNMSGGPSAGSIDARFQKIVGGMDSDTKRAVIDMVRSGTISKKEYVENYID